MTMARLAVDGKSIAHGTALAAVAAVCRTAIGNE